MKVINMDAGPMTPAVMFSMALWSRLRCVTLPGHVAIVVGDENIEVAKKLLRAGEIDGLIGISDTDAGPLIERETRLEGLCELLDVFVDAAASDIGREAQNLAMVGAA